MQDWKDVEPPPGEPGYRDWGALAHEVGKKRLEVLAEVQDYLIEGEDPPDELADQLSAPVCEGCDDCTVREVLDATWPVVEAAIRSGDFGSPR